MCVQTAVLAASLLMCIHLGPATHVSHCTVLPPDMNFHRQQPLLA